jgi:hypothetical protein
MLGEERLVQELGGQGVAFGDSQGNVQELTVLLVDNIVITH